MAQAPSGAAAKPAVSRAASPDTSAFSPADGGAATVPVSAIRQQMPTESILAAARPRRGSGDTSMLTEVTSALEAARPFLPPIVIENIDRSILQLINIDLASGRPALSLTAGAEFWLVAADGDPFADAIAKTDHRTGFRATRLPSRNPAEVKPTGTPTALLMLPPAAAADSPVNRLAFQWVQRCGPKLRQLARQGGPALVASIARLDGEFGLGDLPPDADPAVGGLAGIIKTARLEWPELAYKALDVAANFATKTPEAAAATLLDELLLAGPTEVGITARHRCTIELARTARRPVAGAPVLGAKDVVVVTGGARGVTAEVAVALAEAFRCTLILTGRTPAGTPEPEAIRGVTDEAALKRAIMSHLGPTATPKSVGELYARTLAQREVARTVARIRDAGSKVAYYAVNVSSGRHLADMIHQVTVKFGPVTGLVHGAGVLVDRKIEDLTAGGFRRRLRDQGRGATQPAGAARQPGTQSPDPVQLDDRPVRPRRSACLCRGQRGAEQDRSGRGSPSAGHAGRIDQLGAVGGRHGDARPAPAVRVRGHRADPDGGRRSCSPSRNCPPPAARLKSSRSVSRRAAR